MTLTGILAFFSSACHGQNESIAFSLVCDGSRQSFKIMLDYDEAVAWYNYILRSMENAILIPILFLTLD